MSLENNLVSLPIFQEAIRKRIKAPTINHLYQKFEENDLERTNWEIMKEFPEDARRPLLYTLTTHVTKEKPVFIYAIGENASINKAKTQFIASSTDLLWSLSLMLDDLIDEDSQRADMDTAWVVYGKKRVKDSADIIYEKLLEAQASRINPKAAHFLQECVNDGMRSLHASEIHSLDSSEEDIFLNIDQRARFHCEYPIRAMFEGVVGTERQVMLGMKALYASNRAGQIVNDIKDLVPSDLYGRPLFTDVVGGTVTIPLKTMINTIRGADRKFFIGIFGKKELDVKELSILENLVAENLPRMQIHELISNTYEQFIDTIQLVTNKNDFELFQEWVLYKMSQADKLLLE